MKKELIGKILFIIGLVYSAVIRIEDALTIQQGKDFFEYIFEWSMVLVMIIGACLWVMNDKKTK